MYTSLNEVSICSQSYIQILFCFSLKVIDSLCVTRQECTSFFMGTGFILEEINECVLSCPSGFTRMPGSRCIRCLSSPENN